MQNKVRDLEYVKNRITALEEEYSAYRESQDGLNQKLDILETSLELKTKELADEELIVQ